MGPQAKSGRQGSNLRHRIPNPALSVRVVDLNASTDNDLPPRRLDLNTAGTPQDTPDAAREALAAAIADRPAAVQDAIFAVYDATQAQETH